MDGFDIDKLNYIFIGLGIVVLLIGGIQIPIEAKEDNVLIAKKLTFLVFVMFAIAVFRPVTAYIYDTVLSVRDVASSDDIFNISEDKAALLDENIYEEEVENRSAWFGWLCIFWDTAKMALVSLMRFLAKAVLFIPKQMRYISCMIIEMMLVVSQILSPLFLAMLTVRQTEGTGWRFTLATVALCISPVVFPLVDYIFVEFAEQIAVMCFASFLPSALGTSAGIAEILLVLAKGAAAVSFLKLFGVILAAVIVLFVFLGLCFFYFVAPFVLVKMLASGEVASGISGAFSFMTGHAQKTAMTAIEGSEAAARGAKKSMDVKALSKEEGVSIDIAGKAYVKAGGNMHGAMQEARKMDKEQFTTPQGTYRSEPMPAGMKRPT